MWSSTLVDRLRYYIGDLDASAYIWSDVQLAKFLAVGAIHVETELTNWTQVTLGPYTIDTVVPTISPDPTTNSSPPGYSNLIVLKAAEIISRSELKKLNLTAGWKVTDNKSSIDGTAALTGAKDILKSYKASFDEALKEFKAGNFNAGVAILGPYMSFNINTGFTGYNLYRNY